MTVDPAGVSFCASDHDLIVLMSFQPSGSGQQLRNDDGMLVDHNLAGASSTMPYSDTWSSFSILFSNCKTPATHYRVETSQGCSDV